MQRKYKQQGRSSSRKR